MPQLNKTAWTGNQGSQGKRQDNVEFPQMNGGKVASYDSDSGEDDEESSKSSEVLRRLLKNYADRAGADGETVQLDLNRVESRLAEALATSGGGSGGRAICLVCLEAIGRPDPIWTCNRCYELYHLVCIQKWSSQAIQLCELREEAKLVWCCPKCRHEYSSGDRPTKYLCFCGKCRDPKSDLWLAPHSCGAVCGKRLHCEHTCLLLCHPGPCPACPKVVNARCFCAKSPPMARRCGQQGWSCGQPCHRPLNCSVHKCETTCHEGNCAVCDRKSRRSCRCGRKTEERRCLEGDWSCGQICGKKLQCGKHNCDIECHGGECPPCVRPGQNSCPCGKRSYAESGCRDDLPCCGDTCAKTLDCGFHQCIERCHRGPCPPCNLQRLKRCRCGQKERLTPCNKEFQCESKCKKKRQCDRHPCNRRCCDGRTCPPCEQTCGRQLNCGRHKCAAPCHSGMCYPCPEIAELSCSCGKSKVRVPCGLQKTTRPPKCRHECPRSPDCHHPSRMPHRCHFGPCPPCTQICDQLHHSGCGHRCPLPCHSAVWMDTNKPTEKPATPLDQPIPKMAMVDLPCPPCRHPVPVTCVGKHETGQFPCCEVRKYSCGRQCGRPLHCGIHKCKKQCHQVPESGTKRGEDCDECQEMCSLARPQGCPHSCPNPCHPAPCPSCRQMVKEMCLCGLNPRFINCREWTTASAEGRKEMLSCGNPCPKLMTCGHSCLKTCHEGPCSDQSECRKRITVKCPCGRRIQKILCSANEHPFTCDAECEKAEGEKRDQINKEKQKLKEEEEARKSKEDDENQQNWLRKGKRNRKKKDRNQDDDTDKTLIQKYGIISAAVIIPAILGGWLIYANFL